MIECDNGEERLRALWLKLQLLTDPDDRAREISETLAHAGEAEVVSYLNWLIMADASIADLSDPRGALPFAFGMRIKLWHRAEARQRERRELAATVADEIRSRERVDRQSRLSDRLQDRLAARGSRSLKTPSFPKIMPLEKARAARPQVWIRRERNFGMRYSTEEKAPDRKGTANEEAASGIAARTVDADKKDLPRLLGEHNGAVKAARAAFIKAHDNISEGAARDRFAAALKELQTKRC
jgi:hypothetical protein